MIFWLGTSQWFIKIVVTEKLTSESRAPSEAHQPPKQPPTPTTTASHSIPTPIPPPSVPPMDRPSDQRPPEPRIKQEREEPPTGYVQPMVRDIREAPPSQENKPWGYSGLELMNSGAAFWQNYSGKCCLINSINFKFKLWGKNKNFSLYTGWTKVMKLFTRLNYF